MRVALVTLETTRHSDTTGHRRLDRIARLLASRGHDVTVFCSQWWDDYRDEMIVEGVRYRAVTYGVVPGSFCVRLPGLLAQFRPDIIHARPQPPGVGIAALTGSRLTRAPLAIEWYGDEGLVEGDRFVGRVATSPDRIISPSEYVRTTVRELGAISENTCTIPESIDYSFVESVEPTDDGDVVFAHPLDETANMDDFLLGLAELREREWRATVIGDGPLRHEYEREVSKLRIDDRVTFVGDIDRARRVAIYRGAHAFVQTAAREYFATELLWALACGCVGIVEYQAESSAHELIEHYERSYRVTSPQQIADAILDAGEFDHLTSDDHWEQFDHEKVINQYLNEYREMQEDFSFF